MHMTVPKLARIGVCALAIAIIPAVLPASAQTHSSNNMSNAAAAADQNSDLVPGTGMTTAELQDIGYSQQQISEIRTDMLAQANNGPMDQNASNNASSNPNMQTSNAANNPNTQANNGGGRGGWGLWGLVGLLGLLGLGRGRRTATVHEERDRDVRRIA